MKLTSDVKQRKQRSQQNTPNPNNSYKTKKKFTGSYTEVNPILYSLFTFLLPQLSLFLMRFLSILFSGPKRLKTETQGDQKYSSSEDEEKVKNSIKEFC